MAAGAPPAGPGPPPPRSARTPGSRAARSARAAAMGRGAAPLRRLLLSLLLLPAAGTGAPAASLALGEPETAEELMEYRDPCKAGREAGWLQLWEKFGSTAAVDRCPCEALLGSPGPPGRTVPGLTWRRRREPPGPAGASPVSGCLPEHSGHRAGCPGPPLREGSGCLQPAPRCPRCPPAVAPGGKLCLPFFL